MRIDAHQHFWRRARGDYGWLTPDTHPAISYDFLPGDLLPHLRDAHIDRTILVQAAPTAAETEFLLDIAESTPFVAGVVGWANFESSSATESILALARNRKLVGLRPMLQDIADNAWLLRADIAPAIATMKAAGLTFDALIKPRHLPVLEEFLRRNPTLPVVIDHGAKPDIRRGDIDTWASGIRSVARADNVYCKLSGLFTEAAPGATAEPLMPYVEILLEAFGPSRLMWGSDWPVLVEASSYAAWMSIAESLTGHLSEQERILIFGETATIFYRIER